MNVPGAPLLEASGLVKRYGGLVAIDGVDLTLRSGSITGVIGPNGAGKSTLIGLISGALLPNDGVIRLAGRDISRLAASERARAGIGRTYQIPRPFLNMTVEENLAVAQYSVTPFVRADVARQERAELLVRTGLHDAASKLARDLPLLRRKRLEVARAFALKPRVVLLDEVGAGLVESEITELIDLIRSLLEGTTAILIVEHVIRVVRECCARSLVLNFGKMLVEGPTEEILANDEVAAVYLGAHAHPARQGDLGAEIEANRTRQAKEVSLEPLIARCERPSKTPLLELRGVAAGYGQARVLKGVDLSVAEGETVAILGANGAGKTTLACVITGAIRPTSGTVRIGGEDATRLAQHRIAELGVAHCMEGRRIIPTLSVEENLRIAARRVASKEANERLEAVYQLFPPLAERRRSPGIAMSGGQQQMLAIGRALMARPRLVIFDEISLGLAPVVMDKLYETLAFLKRFGMTLIIIEQDVDRALAIADTAYVLEHGAFGLHGAAAEVASDPRLRNVYIGGE